MISVFESKYMDTQSATCTTNILGGGGGGGGGQAFLCKFVVLYIFLSGFPSFYKMLTQIFFLDLPLIGDTPRQ